MTEDVKLSAIWLASALLLAVAVNSCALVVRAKAEPGDPREYTRGAGHLPSSRSQQPRRHAHRARASRSAARTPIPPNSPSLISLIRGQTEMIARMQTEIAAIRRDIRGNAVTLSEAPDLPVPHHPNPIVAASIIDLPKDIAPAASTLVPVMPATATQRGQFRDQRRTHRHAGIDLGGVLGSPIVASFAGVVLPAPGRDRGYGPYVLVIRGDDGIVYRFAHLATVAVKVGQRVTTGQAIGTMGKVGTMGFPHLHFEMMRVAEYRRRPYGVHGMDPNDYLGGGRGKRMVAGEPMQGQQAKAYTEARR